jgi:alkylhydroperoxidase/carboxymuconolactone decarboxylase family protein YurZ
MKPAQNKMEKLILEEKTENLIAIGAATASNCIPCFEHIFEKAISSGITSAEIKRASEIAEQVKKGAHVALANTVSELIGDKKTTDLPCQQMMNKSCNC